jgi:hypothetical protein
VVEQRRIKQVLINLLSNAVKFTPTGGSIAITLRGNADDSLAIAVTDSGIGIRQEDMAVVMHRSARSIPVSIAVRGHRTRPAPDEGLRRDAWRPADARKRTRQGHHRYGDAPRETRSNGSRVVTKKSAAPHSEPGFEARSRPGAAAGAARRSGGRNGAQTGAAVAAMVATATVPDADNIAFLLLSENQRIGRVVVGRRSQSWC